MSIDTPDRSPGLQATGDGVDRLLDESLRAIAQGPAVDLRALVVAAILEERPVGRLVPRAGHRGAFLRPAAALAGALVVVAGVWLAWQRADWQLDLAERAGETGGRPGQAVAGRSTQPPLPLKEEVTPAPVIAGGNRASAPRQRAKPRLAWVEEQPTQEQVVASNEPYLPGAPAGELGDASGPLPAPPLIAIAPITQAPITQAPIVSAPIVSAPPVSETARPVTDFPSDSQPPAEPSGDAGQQRGDHR